MPDLQVAPALKQRTHGACRGSWLCSSRRHLSFWPRQRSHARRLLPGRSEVKGPVLTASSGVAIIKSRVKGALLAVRLEATGRLSWISGRRRPTDSWRFVAQRPDDGELDRVLFIPVLKMRTAVASEGYIVVQSKAKSKHKLKASSALGI